MKEAAPSPDQLEKMRIAELETELFGAEVPKDSVLEEIYGFLTLEDLDTLAVDLNFDCKEFNLVEKKEQWESLAEDLKKLRDYHKRRTALGANIPAIKELKAETKPIITAIVRKIGNF